MEICLWQYRKQVSALPPTPILTTEKKMSWSCMVVLEREFSAAFLLIKMHPGADMLCGA